MAGVAALTPALTGFPTIFHMKLNGLLTRLYQDKLFEAFREKEKK